MKEQANKPRRLPLMVGGIAAILVSGIAIGSLAISAQSLKGVMASAEPTEESAAPAIAAPGARANRCAECGVIESMREIEASDEKARVKASSRIAASNRGEVDGNSARSYEITIRLQDGSMRVIADAYPARWRKGERVKIIAGVN